MLYQFFVLLTSYVGGEASLLEYLEVKPNMPHPWPLTHSLKPIPLGRCAHRLRGRHPSPRARRLTRGRCPTPVGFCGA